jgi:hypothetical protein
MPTSPLPPRLYRGVNLAMHEAGKGLSPKGSVSGHSPDYGYQSIPYGGPIDYAGLDTGTASMMHQRDQKPFPNSAFVSTTPRRDQAEAYALHSSHEGVIYEIDPALLAAHGIECRRIADSGWEPSAVAVPDDDEYALLTHPPGTPLPKAIVVKEHRVRR